MPPTAFISTFHLTPRFRQLTRSQEAASAQWYVSRQMLHGTRTNEMKPPRKLPKAGPGDVKASRNRFSLLADGESGGDDDDVSIDEPSEPVRKRSATKAKATPKGNGKGKGRGKGKAVSLIAL
jgi:hypothetical protein